MRVAEFLTTGDAQFEKPQGLYVHIPFCTSRCSYCDFHSFSCSYVSERIRVAYLDAIFRELDELEKCLGRLEFRTIYIGGGTPTALEDVLFLRLLRELHERFGSILEEWTVEANPESLSEAKLAMMIENGCSRISLGIQSFSENELEALGRRGTAAIAKSALRQALESGLHVSADLISGIPGMVKQDTRTNTSALVSNVEYLISAGVQHVSLYDLVVEPGTLLERRLTHEELVLPPEDTVYTERKKAESLLAHHGFMRYEISNFALPHAESLHNHIYWSMGSWIGLGSGAVSSFNIIHNADTAYSTLRFEGDKNLERFIKESTLEKVEPELISTTDAAFEMIMMGLRTAQGLDILQFTARFGMDPRELIQKTAEKWAEYFIPDTYSLRLSDQGMDILNRILVDCMNEIQC